MYIRFWAIADTWISRLVSPEECVWLLDMEQRIPGFQSLLALQECTKLLLPLPTNKWDPSTKPELMLKQQEIWTGWQPSIFSLCYFYTCFLLTEGKQLVLFALLHPVNRWFVKDESPQPHLILFERPLSVCGRRDFCQELNTTLKKVSEVLCFSVCGPI